MAIAGLTPLPAPHAELARYIAQHPQKPLLDIIKPYREYEAQLRTVYAQDRQNPALDDPHLNVLPLFTDDTKHITTRARDLAAESEEEKSRYVMPLPDDKRRKHGSPATVANRKEFQDNFNVFSESSLVDLDWSNVVAAGSSVVNCLLLVPNEFNTTKRKLREYYHELFCPASDVDLFLYGLTHAEAVEKMKQIERSIRDALLNEVTVVRTKYAITIVSQYPVRHIQIVLRVYKSVSEILTGFDIDAAGGAYDGKQVYVTPRALSSFISQVNHVDLTRRSPSYENRLSKYSHRNFEVYWPELDRSRIDPTIFERSFQRTLGLARLLVLERLPTTSARETYLNKRRQERGRPSVYRAYHNLGGNIKDFHEDEIADWLSEEDISNYHTFTVPYGQKFNAKRIEKLCYTRDLLLNAEWNKPKEREVYLHRHPAFFGRVEDVIEDCCGSCPKAKTAEEIEVAEKEAEIYISGKVSFLIDDPGRQQIGSFNPLTEQDWTDMAYVGNTARLCQSIVDGDVEDVLNWLSQDGADPNKRDYTGRSPLHLAVMASTPDVVRCLVDHGARLTARLADGKTALHLAASRGNSEMIKILMEKSTANQEIEEERQDRRRKESQAANADQVPVSKKEESNETDSDEGSDLEMVDAEESEADGQSMASSFVKVKKEKDTDVDIGPDESDDEPDYYQIDVLGWDIPCSPLHLAITEGHEDAVQVLCDYGADSILPVKFEGNNDSEVTAILTLTLAISLPREKAKSMAKLLLSLGAISSQADNNGCTAFHRYVHSGAIELIDTLWENDKTGVKTAIDHIFFSGNAWNAQAVAPLHTAVSKGDLSLVLKLLNAGTLPQISFDTWLKAAKVSPSQGGLMTTLEARQRKYKETLEQSIITAVRCGHPEVALVLLQRGADPNGLTLGTEALILDEYRRRYNKGTSLLDLVRQFLSDLREYEGEKAFVGVPHKRPGLDSYLNKFQPGTYKHWVISDDIQQKRKAMKTEAEHREKLLKDISETNGVSEKREAINTAISGLDTLEQALIVSGAKTFKQLFPDIETTESQRYRPYQAPQNLTTTYDYTFSFRYDSDITETRRDGYIDLMEAAWRGDAEHVKLLTLQAWGPQQDQPPLKMDIVDSMANSPFSIAFLRGHYDLARIILDIIKVQWSPPEEDKLRYKLDTAGSDEYDTEDEDKSDDEKDRVVSEKADKTFTIENIGQVSMQVKSHTKPLEVITRAHQIFIAENDRIITARQPSSLFKHAFRTDDVAGMKFLLDQAQHNAGLKFEGDEEFDTNFTFPDEEFRWAIAHGKTQMLALVIRRTGAGIPLDHLVKKSGAKLQQKPPRYYQGLTVYGKKRKDWATAGRNLVVKTTTGLKTPPLLHAALGGSVESVEFFLGDGPHRLYGEFNKSKAGREDSRLKHLNESSAGFDRAIAKWLGADNDLVIHCAVLANPSQGANGLLEYLVNTCPSSLEKKTSKGDSPLMVACRMGRHDYVRILVQGGADQSTRNSSGENILHALLAGNPTTQALRQVLNLLDEDLRSHLFLQRKNLQENATTPLHTWVAQASGVPYQDNTGQTTYRYHGGSQYNVKPYQNQKDGVEVLKLLLEYSKGAELEMLNGAGDTCLHTAMMSDTIFIAKVLLDFRPSLLDRENAVGRTPAEIAHDRVIAEQLKKPTAIRTATVMPLRELPKKKPVEFADWIIWRSAEQVTAAIEKLGLSADYTAAQVSEIARVMGVVENDVNKEDLPPNDLKGVIWDLCRTAMDRHPGRRRLVSLSEANDVAKRLGERYTASRYFTISARGQAEEGAEEEDKEDHEELNQDFANLQLIQRRHEAWKPVNKETAEEHSSDHCPECGRYDD